MAEGPPSPPPDGSITAPQRIIPLPPASAALRSVLLADIYPTDPPAINVVNWLRYGGDEAAQIQRIAAMRQAYGIDQERTELDGVPCFLLRPGNRPPHAPRGLIVTFHAGGYSLGGGEGGTGEAILLAAATDMPVAAVDYRMPPAFPFPAPIDDAETVWRALCKDRDPSTLLLAGSSSGGGLVLALVQRIVAKGLPRPAAVIAGTPWSDLSKTGDSYFLNDIGLGGYDGPLAGMARAYANGLDLTDPRVSPVYGDFGGFPPTMLISGTRDLFLSNTVRVDQRLRRAGVETSLLVIEGHGHASYLDPGHQESGEVFGEIAKFARKHLQIQA